MIDTASGKTLVDPTIFPLLSLYHTGKRAVRKDCPLSCFSVGARRLPLYFNKILLKNDKFTLTINNACVRMWKKEVLWMLSFTMFFTPAMLLLLVLALILLVQGVRRRSWKWLRASLGLFVLVCGCVSLLMEFISRM